MNKAVFLDRDGTINKDKKYLYRMEDFELLPGVLDGLRLLQKAGYLMIVVTNQSGIARGYYTEHNFQVLNTWMLRFLEVKGIRIAGVYYCPHLPDAVVPTYRKICNCRKPGTELFEKAIREFHIDLSKSYAVGDRIRDCAICEQTLCRGFLIGEKEDTDIIQNVCAGKYKNIRYEKDLYACAVRICNKLFQTES